VNASAAGVVRTIARGLLWMVVIILLLFALGVIYLIVFPPFRIAETGTVNSDTQRDVTLRPGTPMAVLQLDVRHDEQLFRNVSTGQLRPTAIKVSSTIIEGGDVPIELRLYPGFVTPVMDLKPGPDRRSMGWSIDCGTTACTRTYLLVVRAGAINSDVRVRVDISARLRFPPHVEAPFLASVGLDLRELPVGDGTALQAAEATGSARLSPDLPAVSQSIALPRTEGIAVEGQSIAGLSLEIDATRVGDMIPVGLRSPPPVRVLLVRAGDGAVVAAVDVPAGLTTGVALPPLEGDYRLVALWQDRAAQAYDVRWRLEQGAVASAPGAAITVGAPVDSPKVEDTEADGSIALEVGGRRPTIDFGVEIELGNTGPELIGPVAGVAHLTLELDEPLGQPPVTVHLSPGQLDEEEGMNVVLQPGQPIDLTLDAIGRCVYRCTPWIAEVPLQGVGGRSPGTHVTIRWRATFQLWDIDGIPDPGGGGTYLHPLAQGAG
jgi:hypothetical protein